MKKFNKKILVILAILSVFGFFGAIKIFAFANPATVNLNSAGNFTILAKTAISTTGATLITGDIGVSPAAATFMTGFSPTMDISNNFSTSTYVLGKLYAANYAAPTPSYIGTAVSAMEAAYTDAMGRAPDETDRLAGTLPLGNTFTAGVYRWGSNVNITGDITLSGSASDVFIFQITGNLNIASGKSVLLSGGVLPSNVFWAVAGTTTLQTTSTFEGNILGGPGASTIAMLTGATLHGKALGQTDVTLDANTVTSAGGTLPHLTVTKVVINDNGRTNVVADFPLLVNATPVTSGVSNAFAAGSYIITETSNINYTQAFSGDCDVNGHITLFTGDNLTCTITNNDTVIAAQNNNSSGGGSAPTYGCNDPKATNYNYFTTSKSSTCIYAVAPAVIAPTSVVVPKLPKTGFPPKEDSLWFGFILNLFR